MRILRMAMLAIGLCAVAAGCGSKNKKAPVAPAADGAAPAGEGADTKPAAEGENPCGPDDGNPCQ